MASVADVIGQALMIIDDVRMQQELFTSPALFYRRYSAYAETAMSLVTSPPTLYQYISEGYTAPEYDDYEWTSTSESVEASVTIQTGKTGYELCSAVYYSDDGTYKTGYSGFTYDSTTGNIVMPAQEKAGIRYDFDFYKDGEFEDVTPRMIRLLALAIAIIWDERFSRNWLNMQPKIKDSAFETVNEANYMDKVTARMRENRQAFSDELRKYEQDMQYRNVVGGIKPLDVFI